MMIDDGQADVAPFGARKYHIIFEESGVVCFVLHFSCFAFLPPQPMWEGIWHTEDVMMMIEDFPVMYVQHVFRRIEGRHSVLSWHHNYLVPGSPKMSYIGPKTVITRLTTLLLKGACKRLSGPLLSVNVDDYVEITRGQRSTEEQLMVNFTISEDLRLEP